MLTSLWPATSLGREAPVLPWPARPPTAGLPWHLLASCPFALQSPGMLLPHTSALLSPLPVTLLPGEPHGSFLMTSGLYCSAKVSSLSNWPCLGYQGAPLIAP